MVGQPGPGDGDELALTLGELDWRRLGEVAEREQIKCLVNGARPGDRPGEQFLERRQQRGLMSRNGEVFAHRQIVEQFDRLPRPGRP